jgi:hypothetical protein
VKATKLQIGSIVFVVVFIVSAVVLLSLPKNASPIVVFEDFEQISGSNFGSWLLGSDVPDDPNNPGSKVQWHILPVSNVSRSLSTSAEFFIDGSQDDGTIWLQRKIALSGNGGSVNVSFWLFSEQESFNTLAVAVAYVGNTAPSSEADFAVVGAANQVSGWKEYTYSGSVNSGSSEVWVAVGISVRWETSMTFWMDDVKIEIG